MKKKSSLATIISIIAVVSVLTAAITAFLVVKDKKIKADKELDEYLEDCIL